jgi:hypothetical protein
MFGSVPKASIATTFFALAGDLEGVQLVDRRRQVEVAGDAFAGPGRHRVALRIEAGVGGDHLVGAGRHAGELVAAGEVREGGQAEGRHLDARAFEEVAGGDVAHDAGDHAGWRGAGGGARRGGKAGEGEEGGQETGHGEKAREAAGRLAFRRGAGEMPVGPEFAKAGFGGRGRRSPWRGGAAMR